MRTVRPLLALLVSAALAACSGGSSTPLGPAAAGGPRFNGTGYIGTGNLTDGTASSTASDSTSASRGTGYIGTGN